jgi:hypothetical protein
MARGDGRAGAYTSFSTAHYSLIKRYGNHDLLKPLAAWHAWWTVRLDQEDKIWKEAKRLGIKLE